MFHKVYNMDFRAPKLKARDTCPVYPCDSLDLNRYRVRNYVKFKTFFGCNKELKDIQQKSSKYFYCKWCSQCAMPCISELKTLKRL